MTAGGGDELDSALALTAALERPIQTAAEDKLERGTFIRRLGDALVAPATKKSTGVIVGITGPWGSGKSSVLNLLTNQLGEAYPEVIVVRFDPWLISGRNDLISEFIAELIAELHQAAGRKKRFNAAISKLVDYGNTLSPLATLVPYGGGAVLKDALKIAKDRLDRQKSLHEQRGRSYLEKIVQLQIPLPILMDDEIWRLVEADLDPLCEEGLIPASRDSIERYTELRRLLVPRLIGTPRDAKRLSGTFSILLRMLAGEVDWIDLLGFCALLAKAPLTVEQLKRDPDAVADDPTSMNEIVARVGDGQPSREVLLDRINPEREGGDDVRRLLGFLFPRLASSIRPAAASWCISRNAGNFR
jgi:predicted KAP-like P-loop ATPase